MPSNPSGPEELHVPTVGELDALREEYDLSKKEFARRAGFDEYRWLDITRHDLDPQASTLRAFVRVLQKADPNGDRPRRGRNPEPACQPDGGIS